MQPAGSRTPEQTMTADAEVRGQFRAALEIASTRECSSGVPWEGPGLLQQEQGFCLQVTALCSGLTISDNSVVLTVAEFKELVESDLN